MCYIITPNFLTSSLFKTRQGAAIPRGREISRLNEIKHFI